MSRYVYAPPGAGAATLGMYRHLGSVRDSRGASPFGAASYGMRPTSYIWIRRLRLQSPITRPPWLQPLRLKQSQQWVWIFFTLSLQLVLQHQLSIQFQFLRLVLPLFEILDDRLQAQGRLEQEFSACGWEIGFEVEFWELVM
ncbi:hypothetical protein Q7P37_002519 [Cladosporium fusiforme]